MIDIIIPTWNNCDLTIECLRSIRKHTPDARIIWIDNGSIEAERAVVRLALTQLGLPWIGQMLRENEGFSKAVNRGFAMAESDPIFLLNNDTIVTAGWTDKMLAVLEEHPRLGILGVVTDTGGIQRWERFALITGYRTGDPEAYFNAQPPRLRQIMASCVPFCCVAIRKETLEAVGKLARNFKPILLAHLIKVAWWRPASRASRYEETWFSIAYRTATSTISISSADNLCPWRLFVISRPQRPLRDVPGTPRDSWLQIQQKLRSSPSRLADSMLYSGLDRNKDDPDHPQGA